MSGRVDINDASLLKKRFDDSGRSIKKYSVAYNLQETAVARVLSGVTNGKNSRKEGQTRRVFCHLKRDGIYIGPLPWEMKQEKEVA